MADFILKEKSFFHYKRNLLGFLKKNSTTAGVGVCTFGTFGTLGT